MAKKTTNIILPHIPTLPEYIDPNRKKVKEGGKVYWLKEEVEMVGYRHNLIPDRTSFIECNDGWFWVYVDGEKTHFRFGPERIKKMQEQNMLK